MTLAQDMPWAAEVTGSDPYVDYASNLAGPEDYFTHLGPQAGRLPGFAEYEYWMQGRAPTMPLSALDPDYLAGLEAEVPVEARRVGALANALLGAFVIPSLIRSLTQGAPVGAATILAGGLIGGFAGYHMPLASTVALGLGFLQETELA